MGIGPLNAELIVREHLRRPLPETVHLVGRQTIDLTLEQALALLKGQGVEPKPIPVEIDQKTLGARTGGRALISDRTFFGLLGVGQVLAIDQSDYEGAEIIIDLNRPLPEALRASVDLLYGGSVLDNVFDPAFYLKNAADLLRVGGRLFENDLLSQHHHAYCLVTPGWLLDYFVLNRFAKCAIYVRESSPFGIGHMYALDPDPDDIISDFGAPRGRLQQSALVIAEKGVESSNGETPIQDQYRSVEQLRVYRERWVAMRSQHDFFEFSAPTPLELCRLAKRTSRSFRYLGIFRPPGVSAETDQQNREGVIRGLRILEATYGGNCSDAKLPKSGVCSLYRGNVTEVLASLFNGAEQHQWQIDVHVLGDPAPQCQKDLEVIYTNLSENTPRVRRAYIAAEASGQTLILP
jgi:hypothetical protein